MARDSQRLEQELIATAREKTGHDIAEWMAIIRESGQTKQTDIHKWLRDNHDINYSQATFLTGIYLNDGQPVYDYDAMFEKLFAGKAHLTPTYDALKKLATEKLDDVEFVPTKHYVSIEGKRIFACATLMKDFIRVGLDLGDTPFGDYAQKAKGLGAMPNLTHMVEIKTPDDVNSDLLGALQNAYTRTHSKK